MFFVNFVAVAMFMAAWGLHSEPKTELSQWIDIVVLLGGFVYILVRVITSVSGNTRC